MRAVVQVAVGAAVHIDGERVGGFDGPGLVALVGVTHDDTSADAEKLASKIWQLRIMRDEEISSMRRDEMAKSAARYLHAQVRVVDVEQEEPEHEVAVSENEQDKSAPQPGASDAIP